MKITRKKDNIKRLFVFLVCIVFAVSSMTAANVIRTLNQITSNENLDTDVDLVITGDIPFAPGIMVNITDTDHAVIILKALKPSGALNQLSHIQINGSEAVNAKNCLVKIYGDGAIILPTPDGAKPLTVYTGINETGESADFTAGDLISLENSPVNNRIRSFLLKRGYMVCFATKSTGYGYSRVFIADTEDKVINLPIILQNSISAIRITRWNDTSKKGYAGNDMTINSALNTTWCYNWDAGTNSWDDREYVTQHHHEGWPSITDVGNNGTSANILGNNEPDNTNDNREHLSTVDEVLANWPAMMATGKRLGSPALSNSANPQWLFQFLDSIDKRGWRCDFVVLHCYWYSDWSSWQSTMNWIHQKTGRPVWITEMNYGANWTAWPGSDTNASDANYTIEKEHMTPVIDGLESTGWIERYAIYNWVQDCRKVYDSNGMLTPIGEYYSSKKSNIAYNGNYEYIPKLPPSKGNPDHFTLNFNAEKNQAKLSWREYDGEYNAAMWIERKRNDGAWTKLDSIPLEEDAATYTWTDYSAQNGDYYRIHIINDANEDVYTPYLKAVASQLKPGNLIDINGKDMFIGGNVIPNSNFDLGMTAWTNGKGEKLCKPYFEVMSRGGSDNGSYLQAWTNDDMDGEGSVKTIFNIEKNAEYYYTGAILYDTNSIPYTRLSLTTDGTEEDSVIARLNASPQWASAAGTFNSNSYSKAMISFRQLGSKAQFDNIQLIRIFDNKKDALTDGIKAARRYVEALKDYNSKYTAINDALDGILNTVKDSDETTALEIQEALDNSFNDIKSKPTLDSLVNIANIIIEKRMPGMTTVQNILDEANGTYYPGLYTHCKTDLQSALANYFSFTEVSGAVQSAKFNDIAPAGWKITSICNTGIQKQTVEDNVTCWKAYYSNTDLNADSIMSINQQITNMNHGLYTLQCQATTEHFCTNGQHAYLSVNGNTLQSPGLSIDSKDVASSTDYWEPLSTLPVYIDDDDTLNIGFTGYGCWWATNFKLMYHPLYQRCTDASTWGLICLPKAFTTSADVTLYQIAGTNQSKTQLYLEAATALQPGVCYIFKSNDKEVNFYETGAAVNEPSITNGLHGYFHTYSSNKARVGGYILANGEWEQVVTGYRTHINSYTGYIDPGTIDNLPVLDSWAGVSMPVSGLTSGIKNIQNDNRNEDIVEYSLNGIRTNKGHGVRIRVTKNSIQKIIK